MRRTPHSFSSGGYSTSDPWTPSGDRQVRVECLRALPRAERDTLGWRGERMECETERVRAVMGYGVEENKYSNDFKSLTFELRIHGNGDNAIAVRDSVHGGASPDRDWSNVELRLKGSILLGAQPELVNSDIKIVSLVPEKIYETINSNYANHHCSHCKALLEDNTKNYCLLGHLSCAKCKAQMCVQCVHVLEKKSITLCKNYSRGCQATLKFDELHRHQIDCRYNDFECPSLSCAGTGDLTWIKHHLQTDHPDRVVFGNEVNRKFSSKDDSVIMVCHDNIFKCVYHYYRSFVDFYVTLVGPSEEAAKFFYEVTVLREGENLVMRRKCSSWNEVMLQKGVTFEKKNLLGDSGRKLNFDVNVRILN